MKHAWRAFRLNLERWAEDYPVATVVVGVILASGAFFGLLALAHGCETKATAACGLATAEKQMGGCGVEARCEATKRAWGKDGGHAGTLHIGEWLHTGEANAAQAVDRRPIRFESGQPPISLQAVAVPLVEGPREAPAGQPAVPPVGPGGRRFWRATIHHTATSPDRPAERVRAIDADHRSRGWDGIGYHFLVAGDGAVFSGRPLDRQGAHVRGENEGNLGIALIGNYTDRPPPEAALAAVRHLLAWAFEAWGFGSEAVYFHRELAATECPGTWDKGVLF